MLWFLLCLRAPATRSGDYTAHAGIGPIDAGAVSMRCCQYEDAIGIVYRCVHGYTCGLIIPGRHPVAEGTALVYGRLSAGKVRLFGSRRIPKIRFDLSFIAPFPIG